MPEFVLFIKLFSTGSGKNRVLAGDRNNLREGNDQGDQDTKCLAFACGMYWIRTSDLARVRRAL